MEPNSVSPSRGENAPWRGWLQLLFGLGLTFLFFYMMAPFMLAILTGAVLAILCYPLHTRLKKKISEGLSALVLTVGMTVGVLGPLAFALYTAVHRIFTIVNRMRLMRSGQTLQQLAEHPTVKKILSTVTRFIPIDRAWLEEQALDLGTSFLEGISGIVGSFLSSMPGLILGFAVMVLSAYFFILDGEKFLRFLSALSPMKADRSRDLFTTFERSCRGVVLGLFLSAIAQALIMMVLFIITDLPNPFLVGFLTIIFGMIPLVGSSPIWIAAAIYLGFQSAWGALGIMIVGGIIVSTVDNVVRPWVMKGHAEMHPFLALVSVFGAVRLMGPTGIFLGPVIAAVFVSFLRILTLELRRDSLSSVASSTT
jgi:predicted PurR-regulated permease PerM